MGEEEVVNNFQNPPLKYSIWVLHVSVFSFFFFFFIYFLFHFMIVLYIYIFLKFYFYLCLFIEVTSAISMKLRGGMVIRYA